MLLKRQLLEAYLRSALDGIPGEEAYCSFNARISPAEARGTQFTCFTSTKVQILTQKLQRERSAGSARVSYRLSTLNPSRIKSMRQRMHLDTRVKAA